MSNIDPRLPQTLGQVQGFSSAVNGTNLTNGVFSSPQGSGGMHQATNVFAESAPMCEDDLNILQDFEEENVRLGNFERIFPLSTNAAHYHKFFEYKRPSNILLMKYLKCLPNGASSLNNPKRS